MILYYALGGGLGHLTRGRRVLDALGISHRAALVTASAYASDERVTGGIPVITVPPDLDSNRDAHQAWLREICRGIERMIVDTFPGGIQGELCNTTFAPLDLVARVVRWDEYRRAVPGPYPDFDTIWCVEELTAEHEDELRRHTAHFRSLDLRIDRERKIPAAVPEATDLYWLIVHSGPEGEVRELVAHAQELRALAAVPPRRVLVASRCTVPLPEGFEAADAVPAADLFPGASRIISAAGFNVMLETEPWRAKHDVVPFPRAFDDQFLRARRRRTS